MSEQEERELQRLVKATSERVDVVRRAKALVAVASGKPFTQAAHEAGLKSGKGVGKLVKRFNTHGLAAVLATWAIRSKKRRGGQDDFFLYSWFPLAGVFHSEHDRRKYAPPVLAT